MRTVLISGADTGIGKTHVTAALARALAVGGARVQVVKPVESGAREGGAGDAEGAAALAGLPKDRAYTLRRFAAALAPVDAAQAEGVDGARLWDEVLAEYVQLPVCDWRLVEGAGGVGVPLDKSGRDWADFAKAVNADAVVLVVEDRLGAINQARMAWEYAKARGLNAGVWLNEAKAAAPAEVAQSTRRTLKELGVPVWGELAHGSLEAVGFSAEVLRSGAGEPEAVENISLKERLADGLRERESTGLKRSLRVHRAEREVLNLADNDYLALRRDGVIAALVASAAAAYGTSASASPLITGWQEPHARLVETLCGWHGMRHGMLWSSGFAANAAILGTLPSKGDLVLADRLIHHSMVAGILRSGAQLKRYAHLDLDALERELTRVAAGRAVFVVTESVFSMDGDYPDLRRMAQLKRRFGFCWIVDEAHGTGWYGPEGAGLVRETGVEKDVDVLVGTLGKTLASGGAYSLFNDAVVRDALVNTAGEFIYSTGLPPTTVVAAEAAIGRVRELAGRQPAWRARSRAFRAALREEGWDAAEGDSPIVPVRVGEPGLVVALAAALREAGVIAAAVRPPTVPTGTSRLRFSLKRTFGEADTARVLRALRVWRAAR